MTERKKQKVLIDIGVLLEHPDIITDIREKQHWPVVLAEAMTSMLELRGQRTLHARNAERVLGQIEGSEAYAVKCFPTGDALKLGDHLAEFRYDGAPAFLFKRKVYSSHSAADRLIEVAAHYGMTVVTCDETTRSLAKAAKVISYKWPLEENTRVPRKTAADSVEPVKLIPFSLHKTPLRSADVQMAVRAFPSEGGTVSTSSGKQVRLGQKLSEGGEGVIYKTSTPGLVCKIYHPNKVTTLKRQKIELMVSRKIDRPGICWPTELVFNQHGEFVGYLMPLAQGKTMQASMFVKPVLLKTFPSWQRIDLVNLCVAFLRHLEYLHSLNIIVGDINPQNLLVTQDSTQLWLVDTDSFQVEAFPCPVGTVNFTAPEIQGLGYESFLRTIQHEDFAVATMLFMILFPGKPPYSQQGGGSPAENIKGKRFPYRDFDDKENFSGENAPQGSWGIIWNHLSKDLRAAFHRTFSRDERLTVDQWLPLLTRYQFSIQKKYLGNEIFPQSYFFIRDPIEVVCGKCKTSIVASKKYADAQAKRGMKVWCQDCHKQNRLKKMAEQSLKEAQEAEKKHQERPVRIPQINRAVPPQPLPQVASARPSRAAPSRPTVQAQAPSVQPSAPPPRVNPQSQVTTAPKVQPQPIAPPRPQPRPAPQPARKPKQSGVGQLLRRLWHVLFFN